VEAKQGIAIVICETVGPLANKYPQKSDLLLLTSASRISLAAVEAAERLKKPLFLSQFKRILDSPPLPCWLTKRLEKRLQTIDWRQLQFLYRY
jgi:hypothetical protein